MLEWVAFRIRAVEDWWFDVMRSVKTTGSERSIDETRIVGQIRDSLTYVPVRAASARLALRELPISDHSQYTFIDMGSGKGRMLFLAAEHAFRKVQGVEFVIDLHAKAQANIRTNNHRGQKCFDIESVHADAADFEFPQGNLVVSLFNSFGPAVLSRVLANLNRSIDECPRHVILLLIYPESAHVVESMEKWRIYRRTRRYYIFQTTGGRGDALPD